MRDAARVPADLLSNEELLRRFHRTLYRVWGCQHWWPGASRFEVIVGAYLTQNTNWTNVERALRQLRSARLLSVAGIRTVSLARLESLIRPSGYFRQKARRLKLFVQFLDRQYAGSLSRMFSQPTTQLRQELLALTGVGRETADSILLYAGQHPVFVVDSYSRRILERHGMISADASYEQIRELCERALSRQQTPTKHQPQEAFLSSSATCHPPSRMSLARRAPVAQVFNDMHGLIVGVGKNFCRKSQALCEQCPLQPFLPAAGTPKVVELPAL